MQHLLTPGPVSIPIFVQNALNKPVIYHRNAEFEEIMQALKQGLHYLFQTNATVMGMIGSGTSGVETLLYSLLRKGDTLAVANLGKFSGRWADYGKMQGWDVVEIKAEWGKTLSKESYLQILSKKPNTKALLLTHCETSTGAFSDIEEIAFAVKEVFPEILILVDGVSSIGAIPFYFDAWKIDGAVVAAQKALLNPTGTVYFALSAAATQQLQPSNAADFFNLWNYWQSAQRNSYPYSPPVNLFYGVIAALQYIQQETLPKRWNETHHHAQVFRKFAEKKGWKIFGEQPADCLTALYHETQNASLIKQQLYENKVVVSGGQDELKGKIIRIAHYLPISMVVMQVLEENL